MRDLSICGQGVYLQVPRRQFYFMEMRRNYTIRYEEFIYERVTELTVEQVSKNEQLSPAQVQEICHRIADRKKKTGVIRNGSV